MAVAAKVAAARPPQRLAHDHDNDLAMAKTSLLGRRRITRELSPIFPGRSCAGRSIVCGARAFGDKYLVYNSFTIPCVARLLNRVWASCRPSGDRCYTRAGESRSFR